MGEDFNYEVHFTVKPKLNPVSNTVKTQSKTHKVKDGHGNFIELNIYQPTKEVLADLKSISKTKNTDLKDKYPYTYNSHRAMMNRMYQKKCKVASNLKLFSNFLLNAGPNPRDTGSNELMTFDRINSNDLLYSIDRCRWATKKEQAINKLSVTLYSYQGENLTLKDWSKRTGVTYHTLYQRAKKGLKGAELLKLTNAAAKKYWKEILVYCNPALIEQAYRSNRKVDEERDEWLARCLKVELGKNKNCWIEATDTETGTPASNNKIFVTQCEYMRDLYNFLNQNHRDHTGVNILGNHFNYINYLKSQPRKFMNNIFKTMVWPSPKILATKSLKISVE